MEYFLTLLGMAIFFFVCFSGPESVVKAWQNGKVLVEQEKSRGMLLVEQEKTKQEEFRTERARLEHGSMQAGSDVGANTPS